MRIWSEKDRSHTYLVDEFFEGRHGSEKERENLVTREKSMPVQSSKLARREEK